MLYLKSGFPEESELVLCTVTGVQHHAVFVKLDEYDKTGFIHISEIAPGRVRNIREYVAEGKKIICKVLRVNQERDQLDLSLRRVSEYHKRQKANQIKQEQLAEKIIEFAAKELGKAVKDLYPAVIIPILKTYPYLHPCFEEVVTAGLSLESLGIDKKIAKALEALIRQRIKPPQVEIEGTLTVVSYEPEGAEDIKTILSVVPKDGMGIKYVGGGKYQVSLIDKEYKAAEERLAATVEKVMMAAKKAGAEASFARDEKGKKQKGQQQEKSKRKNR
ncbi:S1 RNA-binding domain-containing protein [Candidatus Woesearchaeota archaeon]|nr:S1 RNA-binding domain-containing protein [Candidatus Woesearchaeota archaeon]